jgi:hypothetical protein
MKIKIIFKSKSFNFKIITKEQIQFGRGNNMEDFKSTTPAATSLCNS